VEPPIIDTVLGKNETVTQRFMLDLDEREATKMSQPLIDVSVQ
jgi:hypothetical protein